MTPWKDGGYQECGFLGGRFDSGADEYGSRVRFPDGERGLVPSLDGRRNVSTQKSTPLMVNAQADALGSVTEPLQPIEKVTLESLHKPEISAGHHQTAR